MSPEPSRIFSLASAFYDSAVLFAAIDVGIFETLATCQPANTVTMAQAAGLSERGTALLLDACVAIGLLEKSGGAYRNTPESQAFLVPGRPSDLSGAIRYNRDVYPLWHRLGELVRSGKPVEPPQVHLGEDPGRTRRFVLSMHGRALAASPAVLPFLDLAGKRQLLDIGGGPGTWSVLLAKANPSLRCTVLDLPPVAKIAAELIAGQGMADRVQTLSGDYHDTPFPCGHDVALLFGMLHQETPEDILRLLRKTFDALCPGGTVYVMDMMTDATHTAPKFSALFALNMALTTENGWVFSDEQLRGWMEAAGFEGFQVRPLPAPIPHWLAQARKPVT